MPAVGNIGEGRLVNWRKQKVAQNGIATNRVTIFL